jgi:hypothetical protein
MAINDTLPRRQIERSEVQTQHPLYGFYLMIVH